MNTLYIQQSNMPSIEGTMNMPSVEVMSFLEAAQQANWLANSELWEICEGLTYAAYLEKDERG